MLRERKEAPSLKLDSRRGRGDGLDEKLRDCAHFSQHTILYTKTFRRTEEIHIAFTQILINFCFNVTISLEALVSTQPLLVSSS